MVYVDETGFNEHYAREHAYSKKGVAVFAKVSGKKYARTNLVAGLLNNKIVGEMLYKENMKSPLFENWFEFTLIPRIPRKSYIVLDNATFHRKKQLRKLARKYKCKIIFLPPYSPELNPIEKRWANTKKKLRSNSHLFDDFFQAILFNL